MPNIVGKTRIKLNERSSESYALSKAQPGDTLALHFVSITPSLPGTVGTPAFAAVSRASWAPI